MSNFLKKKLPHNIVSSTAIFLPNYFALWQFSNLLEHLKGDGKLPNRKVTWQKIAVELTKQKIPIFAFLKKGQFRPSITRH